MARQSKAQALTLNLKGIRQQPDGRWRFEVERALPDGSKYRKSSAYKDQADAIKGRDDALAEYKALCDGAQLLTDNNQTLAEWAEHCLSVIMVSQSNRRGKPYTANTLRGYRQLIECYVEPSIGPVKLSKLSVDHIDSLIASLSSESLKINVKNCLSRMLELAEAKGKRAKGSNPCKGVTIGRTRNKRTDAKTVIKTRVNINGKTGSAARYRVDSAAVPTGLQIESKRVLSFDEEAKLLEFVGNHPDHSGYLTPIMLGLKAGLRIAESLGLDWHNVDFDANVIRIEQQAQRVTGKGYQTYDPKSQAGFRIIPMTKSLAEHLQTVKQSSTSAHVVCNSRGDRRDAARAHNTFKVLCEACGLGDKVQGHKFIPRPSFHDLRRTCLTRLATGRTAPGVSTQPVPPTILIRLSGHEDIATLLSFYTVANDSDLVAAMATMP